MKEGIKYISWTEAVVKRPPRESRGLRNSLAIICLQVWVKKKKRFPIEGEKSNYR